MKVATVHCVVCPSDAYHWCCGVGWCAACHATHLAFKRERARLLAEGIDMNDDDQLVLGTVFVTLTPAEKARVADDLALALRTRAQLEAEQKAARADMRAQRDELDRTISRLRDEILTGKATRPAIRRGT